MVVWCMSKGRVVVKEVCFLIRVLSLVGVERFFFLRDGWGMEVMVGCDVMIVVMVLFLVCVELVFLILLLCFLFGFFVFLILGSWLIGLFLCFF